MPHYKSLTHHKKPSKMTNILQFDQKWVDPGTQRPCFPSLPLACSVLQKMRDPLAQSGGDCVVPERQGASSLDIVGKKNFQNASVLLRLKTMTMLHASILIPKTIKTKNCNETTVHSVTLWAESKVLEVPLERIELFSLFFLITHNSSPLQMLSDGDGSP